MEARPGAQAGCGRDPLVSRSRPTAGGRRIQTPVIRSDRGRPPMKDQNAQQLLAKVMDWQDPDVVSRYVPSLQLLADYKYDHYQRFSPGNRFIESLALWLNQFDKADRPVALD